MRVCVCTNHHDDQATQMAKVIKKNLATFESLLNIKDCLLIQREMKRFGKENFVSKC